VEGESLEESMEGVSATRREVLAEAVSSNIFHLMLVRQRGHSTSWIVFGERLVEEYKICEPATNCDMWFLEGREVGLKTG
jgi:hypothetical protein